MSNIIGFAGKKPEPERKIGDMKAGEVGYTVEWAIKDNEPNEEFFIGSWSGTASVRVECVRPHVYSVTTIGRGDTPSIGG